MKDKNSVLSRYILIGLGIAFAGIQALTLNTLLRGKGKSKNKSKGKERFAADAQGE